jgi:hypothetical protein
MESQQKVSMSTDLEAAIITSFSTILPSILVGNKKEGTGGTFDWLKGYLKDYSVWDPAGRKSGVSSRICDGIKVAMKRAEGLLALTTDDIEAVKVASGLISDSCTFITSLCTWIESSHRELTADTPYTSSEVWDMQLECLEQIFEELHQARVAVVDAARLSQGIFTSGACLRHGRSSSVMCATISRMTQPLPAFLFAGFFFMVKMFLSTSVSPSLLMA